MLDETVVTIFKNNQNISVTPADVNVLLNFIKSHQEVMKRLQPCFEEICLPGMTEEYKLPVFFKYNEVKLKTDPTNADGSGNPADLPPHRCLKLVYACQDSNPKCLELLSVMSDSIFNDLKTHKIVEFLEKTEANMF